jgi:hypothetical protein
MDIRIGGRGCGKTTELVKLAARNHAVIVCFSTEAARHVQEVANKLKLQIEKPLCYDEVLRGRRLMGVRIKGQPPRLMLDNAEIIMQSVFSPYEVLAATITRG